MPAQSLQSPQFQFSSNPDGFSCLKAVTPAPGAGPRRSGWRRPATMGGTPPRCRPSMVGPGTLPGGAALSPARPSRPMPARALPGGSTSPRSASGSPPWDFSADSEFGAVFPALPLEQAGGAMTEAIHP